MRDQVAALRRGIAWRQRSSGFGSLGLLMVLGPLILPPIVLVLWTSFLTEPLGQPGSTFTLRNWQYVFTPEFVAAVRNTVLVSGVASLVAVPIGFAFAWLRAVSQSTVVGKLLNVAIIPLVFSPLLTTIAWITLAAPRSGPINVLARNLGLADPLFDIYSLTGMTWVTLLYMVPVAFLTTRGFVDLMDASALEAARAAGAPPSSTFFRITIPLAAPALGAAVLLTFTRGIGIFSIVTLLGPTARIRTLQRDAFLAMAEAPTEPARAATIGTVLALMSLILMAVYRRVIRNPQRFSNAGGGRGGLSLSNSSVIVSRRTQYALAAALLGFIVVAVVLPYTAIAYGAFTPFLTPELDLARLSLTNFNAFLDRREVITGLVNTGILVVVGGMFTTLVAWAVASKTRLDRTRTGRVLEFVTFAPIAIPGLSFALGLLWAVLALELTRDLLYGSLVLIFLAQMASFLPLGSQVIGAGILQMGRDINNAARTSGAGLAARLTLIVGPLLFPALISAWLIIGLQALVEAGMSIFLYTGRSITTAVNVFVHALGGSSSIMYAGAFLMASVGIVAIVAGEYLFGAVSRMGRGSGGDGA